MVRFDQYWGGIKDRPAGFDHHYVPDGRARLNALRSGQANIALIDPRQIPEAKGAGLQVQINEKNGVWDIYINLSRAGLSDLRVRKALMHAIDREALADALSFGASQADVAVLLERVAGLRPGTRQDLSVRPEEGEGTAGRGRPSRTASTSTSCCSTPPNTAACRGAAGDARRKSGIKLKFDTVDASQFPSVPPPAGARRYPDGALGRPARPAADLPGTHRDRRRL